MRGWKSKKSPFFEIFQKIFDLCDRFPKRRPSWVHEELHFETWRERNLIINHFICTSYTVSISEYDECIQMSYIISFPPYFLNIRSCISPVPINTCLRFLYPNIFWMNLQNWNKLLASRRSALTWRVNNAVKHFLCFPHRNVNCYSLHCGSFEDDQWRFQLFLFSDLLHPIVSQSEDTGLTWWEPKARLNPVSTKMFFSHWVFCCTINLSIRRRSFKVREGNSAPNTNLCDYHKMEIFSWTWPIHGTDVLLQLWNKSDICYWSHWQSSPRGWSRSH